MPPRRRYKAPAGNGEILADPPFRRVSELVELSRERLDRTDVAIGGMPLRELRTGARQEILFEAACLHFSEQGRRDPIRRAQEYAQAGHGRPLLLAGHQPELSHAGVWAKNFALNGLANRIGGIPLNLVVDNDTLKSTSLRFPTFHRHDPTAVRLESVAFDHFTGEVPYEDRRVQDAEFFRTFPDRAAEVYRTWGVNPVLPRVWADVLADPSPIVGEKFAATRRKWEREWGCSNFELPVSRLVKTQAFRVFVEDLVKNCERFRGVYNAAVRAYRRANHIRSRSHPVPDLRENELPFWGPMDPKGRRQRLTCQTIADPSHVRPRALTLTLFARVCLGDFFIHGIGGGKYDEVTDAIIRDYYGVEPPEYQVVSATLHLPLPEFPTTQADVIALARRERDVYWNPQRHVPGPERERPEVRELVRRHRQLAASEPFERAERRRWFSDLRSVGDQLREILLPRMGEASDWLTRARQEVAANAVLHRRDFAWVLYPEAALKPFLQQFLTPLL
jgi:hypothetical protein